MTPAQVAALRTQGFEPSGIPLGNGDFYVTGTSPVKEKAPTGTVIPMSQYYEEVKNGQNIQGVPLPDGKFYVTSQQPFAPRKGQETIINKDGSITIRDVALGEAAGDKTERVAKAQEQMKNESLRLIQANTEEARNLLDEVGTNNPVAAAGNAVLAKVLPASQVGEMQKFFERINGENSFQKMNQLRASSPTGGAAGTMTEKEWPRFEGRFSPLDANAKKDTLAKSLSLNALNAFEAANGTPQDVIKLLEDKKIDQATYDNYVSEYMKNREIAQVGAAGIAGSSYGWTKLNKDLLNKSTIFEEPAGVGLDKEAKDALDFLNIPQAQ
jgi:hypothetical protein